MNVFYSNVADSYIRNNIDIPLNEKIKQVVEGIENDTYKKYTNKYDKLLIWVFKSLEQISEFDALVAELKQLQVLVTKTFFATSKGKSINGVAFYWNATPYIIVEEIDDIESIFIHEVCHFIVRHFAQENKIRWKADEEAVVIQLEKELCREIYMEPQKVAQKIRGFFYDAKSAKKVHEMYKQEI